MFRNVTGTSDSLEARLNRGIRRDAKLVRRRDIIAAAIDFAEEALIEKSHPPADEIS